MAFPPAIVLWLHSFDLVAAPVKCRRSHTCPQIPIPQDRLEHKIRRVGWPNPAFCTSLFQAEEQVSGGRVDGAKIGAKTIGDGIAARHPTAGGGHVGILLQRVAAGGWPKDFDAIGAIRHDDEFWHTGHLYHIDQAPETTGQGELSACHWHAGIVLANGAAHGESAAGAGAAATGDFIPVHRVGLP